MRTACNPSSQSLNSIKAIVLVHLWKMDKHARSPSSSSQRWRPTTRSYHCYFRHQISSRLNWEKTIGIGTSDIGPQNHKCGHYLLTRRPRCQNYIALYSILISDDQGLPVSDIDGRKNRGRCFTKAATLHAFKDHPSNSRNDPAFWRIRKMHASASRELVFNPNLRPPWERCSWGVVIIHTLFGQFDQHERHIAFWWILKSHGGELRSQTSRTHFIQDVARGTAMSCTLFGHFNFIEKRLAFWWTSSVTSRRAERGTGIDVRRKNIKYIVQKNDMKQGIKNM